MGYRNIKSIASSSLVAFSLALGLVAHVTADQLDQIHSVNKKRTSAGQSSQARIDKLSDERLSLLDQYKAVNKEIDGLRIYNKQKTKEIANQKKRMAELDQAILQAAETKRQITPLIEAMVNSLEQYIELDLPFQLKERRDRIQYIREQMENSNVSDAEKFRLILEAYQIEINDYGRKITTDTGTIEIDGAEVGVNILQIGRIALVAQTKDERTTLASKWDANEKAWTWEKLSNDYRNPIRKAIRIARKQATTDILMLPIAAPEVAE